MAEPKIKQGPLLVLLFLGVLMGAMDIAIVGPALPLIGREFGVNARDLTWLFTIYVLFNLVGTPLMAKLSDTFGRKVIYIIDVVLFGAGSLLLAFSGFFHSMFWVLILARAIQGFGAGGIFPVASAVIGDTFPPEKRGRALGLIGAVFGIAFIIGPILGGLILPFGWPWLFFINIPLAAVIIIMGAIYLPVKKECENCAFDWAGMIVLTVMLSALAFGINRIDTERFLPSLLNWYTGGMIVLAALLFPVFYRIERDHPNPIVRMQFFRSRQVSFAGFINLGAGIAESSIIFLPMLAIMAFGVKPSAASFLLMPLVLAMSFGSPSVGFLLDRFGSRTVIVVGSAVMTVGMVLLTFSFSGMAVYVTAMVVMGLGLSALLGAPIRYIMLGEAKPNERGQALGLVNVGASMGQLMGGAAIGALIASSGGGPHGYRTAFWGLSFFTLLVLAASFFLDKRSIELKKHEQDKKKNKKTGMNRKVV